MPFDVSFNIVLGTDTNCCGALNVNLFAATRDLISRLEDAGKEIALVSFSEKALVFAKKEYRRYHKLTFLLFEKEHPSFSLAAIIMEYILKRQIYPIYKQRRSVDKYIIVFNRYINIAQQRVSAYVLFSPELIKRLFFPFI